MVRRICGGELVAVREGAVGKARVRGDLLVGSVATSGVGVGGVGGDGGRVSRSGGVRTGRDVW